MPSLKSLQERGKRTISIPDDEGGEPLELVIWPNKFTQKLARETQEAAKAEDTEEVVRLFMSVVAGWNLREDDDPTSDPLPLTPEVLNEIGMPTLLEIQEKIGAIISPNRETASS